MPKRRTTSKARGTPSKRVIRRDTVTAIRAESEIGVERMDSNASAIEEDMPVFPTVSGSSTDKRTPSNSEMPPENASVVGDEGVDLKTAITIVPVFKGKNDNVENFIRQCERANRSVALSKRAFFLNMIRAKCTEDASDYLLGLPDHENLDGLLKDLQKAFGASKDYNQWVVDLSSVCQKYHESVRDYGTRVSKILTHLINSARQTYTSEKAFGVIEGAKDNAINCFITGLKNGRVADRVEKGNPTTLREAINLGLEEEKRVAYRDKLKAQNGYKGPWSRPEQVRVAHVRDENKSHDRKKLESTAESNKNGRETRTCHRCGAKGHISYDCRTPWDKIEKRDNGPTRGRPWRNYENRRGNDTHKERQSRQRSNKTTDDLNSKGARSNEARSSQTNQKPPATYVSTTTATN